MFPGMNPKKMQSMLKQLGMQQIEVDAKRVVIEASGKDIIIENPSIQKIKFQGKETFQISGDIVDAEFSEEDVSLVAEKTEKTKEEVRLSLKKTKDIAKSILELSD